MKFSTFLKLVEIQTKLASIMPFIFSTIYAIYSNKNFNLINFFLMFFSMIFFDMSTTAINNYIDYKKAKNKELIKKNIIYKEAISEKIVLLTIIIMLAISIILGIILVLKCGLVILVLGTICFMVGVLYTFGPIPISRMPLGELFSGFFLGFVLIYISIYIHNTSIATIGLDFVSFNLNINIDLVKTIFILIVSMPFVLTISNIMLANNICDIEEDIINDRFLLPYYIGIDKSLLLYKLSYISVYLFIIISIFLKILPIISITTLLSIFIVKKNTNMFMKKQKKDETFILSVKNLLIVSVFYIIPLVITIIF